MLSLCLPELPLLDLVRVAIFFHLLIFSKNLHLLPPKRKLHPCETHLALSHVLRRPLPLNSGRDWAECLHSLKQHFSWGKQRTTSSEFPGGRRGQVKYGDFWSIPDPLDQHPWKGGYTWGCALLIGILPMRDSEPANWGQSLPWELFRSAFHPFMSILWKFCGWLDLLQID